MQDAEVIGGVETLPDYARMLAKFGRFEDAYIVHAAEGETVVPLQVLDANPALKEMLFNQMRDMGLDPEQYIVGNEMNSINPATGQPEFFFKELWKGVKKVLKIAAPVLGAIAGSFIPIPIVGPMIGSFVASKIAGYDTKSALIGAAASGIGAYGLGGSAAAAAGGYVPGLAGIGGTSLGSALYGGLSQAPSAGAGLASLFQAAPSVAQVIPTAAPATAAATTAATTAAPAAATAAGTTAFGGTVVAPLVNFALKNPGMVLAGGAMLASLLDKPENVKLSKKDRETGMDVYKRNPDEYNIGNLGPAPVSYGGNDASQYQVSNYAPIPTAPPIDYGTTYAQFPVQSFQYARAGGHIKGPGTGTSDSIPAMLSDGEFVMTAKAVRGAGGGDRKKGARKMYKLMRQFEALHG